MDPLTVDSRGRLQLPADLLRDLGRRPLLPVSGSDRHCLIAAADEGGELVLAGRLGEVGMADLLSFLGMFRKSGRLHLRFDGGTRTLVFRQGDIVAAASTFAEDDLGDFLCAAGRLDRAQLRRLRDVAAARGDLERVLAGSELVTGRDLWLARRQRAEEIVYRLFAASRGSFAFFADPAAAPEEPPAFTLNTQNLIMEGLRRVDESAVYLRRIGPLDQRVTVAAGDPEDLDPQEAALVARAAEARLSVSGLLRDCGLGEFEALRQVSRLLEKGALALEAAPAPPPEGLLGELLTVYNGALGALYRRLVAVHPGFTQQVRSFLKELPRPFAYVLDGVVPAADGTLDGTRIAANLAGLGEGDRLRLAADALNELVFMECRAARRELKAEEAAELTRRVQELTGRVKTLLGRME